MIALAPLLLLGGVVFVEEPIDGLSVEEEGQAPYRVSGSWRSADIDGDGANDIVTPAGVAFQQDGHFPKTRQTPLPDFGESARADIWKSEIYVLMPGRIEALRWGQGDWQRTLSQPIDWTNLIGLRESKDGPNPRARHLQFQRFLHDIDDDGKPEIVLVSKDGLRVYARTDLFYEEKALWSVYPKAQPLISAQSIWPASNRVVEPPALFNSATFELNEGLLTVRTTESHGTVRRSIDRGKELDGAGGFLLAGEEVGGARSYKQQAYRIALDGTFALSETPESVRETMPVSTQWTAVRLNDDGIIDLLRIKYAGSTASAYPVSIFEVTASTDGGKTVHAAQCSGSYPHRVAVDFNQDGRLDLVTESKQLLEGGIKETLVRGLTRREVDLDVEVRLQDDRAGFPAKPSFRRRFTITLDKPPAAYSKMFMRFLEGKSLRIDCDVDGDKVCDAVVHDRPNSLSVFKGKPDGISADRIATIPAVPGVVFAIVDVDQDGRADALVSEGGVDASYSVFLSRDAAP